MNQELLKNPEVQEIIIEAMRFYKLQNSSNLDYVSDEFVAKHTKPPVILTTEGGVKVTDPNCNLYGFYEDAEQLGFRGRASWCDGRGKLFSTLAARDEYILWNKPCLTGKEVETWYLSSGTLDSLDKILKSKQTT